MKNTDNENLVSRIKDLCRMSEEKYIPSFTGFMSEDKQRVCTDEIKRFEGVFYLTFGGVKNAVRKMIGVFSKDVYVEPENSDGDFSDYSDMAEITAVKITGSGYREFSHRDVYGAVMSLGIKREAVGDIFVTENKYTAYMVLVSTVVGTVIEQLLRVANDKVTVEVVPFEKVPDKCEEYSYESVTLSSARLDALVSAALNLSRDKAKKLIDSGKVFLNHAECLKCDKEFTEGDVFSVRGFGKFRIDGDLGKTQKGRTRIIVKKYK